MDLTPSPKAQELRETLEAFMASHVMPAEPVYAAQRERLVAEWNEMGFEELQRVIREVVDRVEVDGASMQLYMRS